MSDCGILSLVPAFITIIVAITARNVAVALFAGVAGGAFVFSSFSFTESIKNLSIYIFDAFADIERVKIAIFVMLIGGLLQIISRSGAYTAFSNFLSKYLSTPRKARIATWGLSILVSFDDYANILITGSSMKPLLLKHGEKPAKIAYIVDTAAGFTSVMLISTWAAFESSLMLDSAKDVGFETTASAIFVASIPYHFYTFLALFLTFVVCFTGKWFGDYTDKKEKTSEKTSEKTIIKQGGSAYHVFTPFLVLLFTALTGLTVSGYIVSLRKGITNISPIQLFGNAPSIDILVISAFLSIATLIILLYKDKVLNTREMSEAFFKGIKGMINVALIIILASSLSSVSSDLGTGIYIAHKLEAFISPTVLPAIIFITAFLISVATGFSWSSMAIMMPVAFQLATTIGDVAAYPIVAAATISGAIAGDQVVPYSDLTVLTAATTGISSIHHTKTQLPQVMLPAIASIFGYIIMGLGLFPPVAFALSVLLVFTVHKIFAK